MSKFIAAMDHSGGSTGGVLERYGISEWNDGAGNESPSEKMRLVHDMRLRMVNSPLFTSKNIWAAILYKDTVDRGMVNTLDEKRINAILKIDSGCNEDGTLKDFDVEGMGAYAQSAGCMGTKMRSIVKSMDVLQPIINQQFELAEIISKTGLVPIVEPEIPIDHPNKAELEEALLKALNARLNYFKGKCILKLTLPEEPNLYWELLMHQRVHKIVGLSGGYTTEEACRKLSQQDDMIASFSRALSEGLFVHQTEEEFNTAIGNNINMIVKASNNAV